MHKIEEGSTIADMQSIRREYGNLPEAFINQCIPLVGNDISATIVSHPFFGNTSPYSNFLVYTDTSTAVPLRVYPIPNTISPYVEAFLNGRGFLTSDEYAIFKRNNPMNLFDHLNKLKQELGMPLAHTIKKLVGRTRNIHVLSILDLEVISVEYNLQQAQEAAEKYGLALQTPEGKAILQPDNPEVTDYDEREQWLLSPGIAFFPEDESLRPGFFSFPPECVEDLKVLFSGGRVYKNNRPSFVYDKIRLHINASMAYLKKVYNTQPFSYDFDTRAFIKSESGRH